jgi:hypothetical protein
LPGPGDYQIIFSSMQPELKNYEGWQWHVIVFSSSVDFWINVILVIYVFFSYVMWRVCILGVSWLDWKKKWKHSQLRFLFQKKHVPKNVESLWTVYYNTTGGECNQNSTVLLLNGRYFLW